MKFYDKEKKTDLLIKLVFTLILFVFCIVVPIFKTSSLVLIILGLGIDVFIFFKNIKPYFKTISEYRQHVGTVNSFDLHLAAFFEPHIVNETIRKIKAKPFVEGKKSRK